MVEAAVVHESDNKEHITARLVEFAKVVAWSDLPESVRHEGRRAFTNAVGCLVGGAKHQLVETASAALLPFSGAPEATLVGRGARADCLTAALINGLSGAAYSFDDTYGEAMLHPGGPLAAALLAVCEYKPTSGERLICAFTTGLELACRLTKALTMPPAKAEMAWSQTGISCGIAVGLATGKLLGLDRQQLAWTAGIASASASGTRVTHGSMAASLIFGQAAQNGLRAAILALHGFTGPPHAIEGQFGVAEVFAYEAHLSSLVDGLGEQFELLGNTYKPFPCGLVIHPALDGLLRLRAEAAIDPAAIEAIELVVSPKAIAFASRADPADDLEAKISLHHWIAAAALTGRAGLAEGTLEMVRDPRVAALRAKIMVEGDPALAADAARVVITLSDGTSRRIAIDHCVGSREHPMSDIQIEQKFIGQAALVIGEDRARALFQAASDIARLSDAAVVAQMAA